LSRQGLFDPVKLAYDPRCGKAGSYHQRFKQLGHYASSSPVTPYIEYIPKLNINKSDYD